jgi:hypothetical protein
MIFDAGSLLRIVTALAEEEGVPVPVSLGTLRAIVIEAERLAAGRTEHEPAALFYASARSAHLFAKTARPFLDGIGRAQAVRVGLALDADELDIILLRGRIGHRAAHWMDVREAFAGWLRPSDEPPRRRPPKRPR